MLNLLHVLLFWQPWLDMDLFFLSFFFNENIWSTHVVTSVVPFEKLRCGARAKEQGGEGMLRENVCWNPDLKFLCKLREEWHPNRSLQQKLVDPDRKILDWMSASNRWLTQGGSHNWGELKPCVGASVGAKANRGAKVWANIHRDPRSCTHSNAARPDPLTRPIWHNTLCTLLPFFLCTF